MTIKNIKISSLFLVIIIAFMTGCNKDKKEDDPILNEDSYLTVKIDGNLLESKNVTGGSLDDLMQFYAYDISENLIFVLTVYKYSGEGNYDINEDIVIQYNGDLYQGNDSYPGTLKITYANQLDVKINLIGEFNGTFSDIIDTNNSITLTEGKFQVKPK